jgi:hypothetical protein
MFMIVTAPLQSGFRRTFCFPPIAVYMMWRRLTEFNMTQGGKSDSANGSVLQEQSDKFAAKTKAKPISGAARRALEEAEKRRKEIDAAASAFSDEVGGRKGPEPVRYGDWEKKGIASDF